MENINQNKPFLSLQHLVKVYPNGEKAVYDFNLDIYRNEFIVIVGPSGCGKSTTLRMVAGLEDISDGNLYMGDELLNYKPSSERNMAIVFQSYALYPQMTVFDNIAFPLTINKYSMPVVNIVLRAAAEIENVLNNIPFADFAKTMSDITKEKGKEAIKEENVASTFAIAYESAQLLYKAFAPFKTESAEALTDREQEIKDAILAEIRRAVGEEKVKIAQKGTAYDENFCEVDKEGGVKTELRKFTPYEIKTRVYETAEKLDLVHYLDKLPKELSGEQMQRVALGRAIIKKVPIFMMDEPLSNLDAKLRLTMRSEIVRLHNSINATTIYVTHDQTEAMTMASRIVVMSRGFIQQIGSPEEVYNNPANIFVAKFIGSPTMNVFDVELDRENMALINGDLKISVSSDFIKKQDAFYNSARERFASMLDNFDATARDSVLKMLSVTGEYSDRFKHKKQKTSLVGNLKKLFGKLSKKKEQNVDPYEFERNVCTEKLQALKDSLAGNNSLVLGIRPERIKLEKCTNGKQYRDCLIVKPNVVELLGGEYNVHFTFCGKNMVGQIDAKDKVTVNDDVAVKFAIEDLYVFDPVTGDVIK